MDERAMSEKYGRSFSVGGTRSERKEIYPKRRRIFLKALAQKEIDQIYTNENYGEQVIDESPSTSFQSSHAP